ncbi:hypothetical protein ATANTOWER_026029, partial [Ataeniobius toweri]|nr:hypothetical protein [Ataeniobius toweri]
DKPGGNDESKAIYPGPEVLRFEELYFCLTELQGFCHIELISARAVDVIVLKFSRPSVLLWEGLAPLVGSEVVMCSISLLPTCSQRKNFLFRFSQRLLIKSRC